MLLLLLRGSGIGVPIVVGPFFVEALGVFQGGAAITFVHQGGAVRSFSYQGGSVVSEVLVDG